MIRTPKGTMYWRSGDIGLRPQSAAWFGLGLMGPLDLGSGLVVGGTKSFKPDKGLGFRV